VTGTGRSVVGDVGEVTADIESRLATLTCISERKEHMMTQDQREATDQMPRDAPFELGGDVVVQRPIPLTLEEPRGITATTSQLTHAGPQPAAPRPVASRPRCSASPDHPTWDEAFYERASLIGAPAFYGPPVIFLLGPWLLLVLMLAGPFALILTILVALAVGAGLLAVVAAVIASPYLLIRHLCEHGKAHAKPRAPRHRFRKHRGGSGRLGRLLPKEVS
jgi:hypothetical protein